jgi:hypothetical protein
VQSSISHVNYLGVILLKTCVTFFLDVFFNIRAQNYTNRKYYRGNSIRLTGAYNPSTKKHILKCRRFLAKNYTCTSPQYIRGCQFSRKTDIFCKKEKIYFVKNLIFGTKFCLFTHVTQQVIFLLNDFVGA